MAEGIGIKDVNEKIRKKINDGNYPEPVKEFLTRMLISEFEHIDEARPRLNDDYESNIKKYALQWEGEEE